MALNFNSTTDEFYDVTGTTAEGYLNWAGVLKVMRLYNNTLLSSHATWAPPTGARAGTEASTFASDLLEPIWTTIGPKTTAPQIRPTATFTRPGYTETSTTLPDEITQLLTIARLRFDSLPWKDQREMGNTPSGMADNSGESYNWQWPRRNPTTSGQPWDWLMPADIAFAFALYASYLGMIRLNERGAWRRWATDQGVTWGERRRRFDLDNDVEYAQGSSQQEREHLTTLLGTRTNTSITLTGNNLNVGDKVVINDGMIDIPYDVQKYLWNYIKPINTRQAESFMVYEKGLREETQHEFDIELQRYYNGRNTAPNQISTNDSSPFPMPSRRDPRPTNREDGGEIA